MILVIDLDDTLYAEHNFVISGMRAVAQFGSEAFGLDAATSLSFMMHNLEAKGRGRVFNAWLTEYGLINKQRVAKCIKVYRHHQPDIAMPKPHRDLLIRLQQLYSLYLVTDGHKITQQRKVEALGVATYFKRIFITHQFGIVHAKPSLYCFEQIKKAEGCEWADILYLGDNPAKDFVSLNQVGAVTVRVRTGAHASVVGKPGFDATHHIERLTDFETLLSHLTG
tara:strand:+ start:724 stop:1395 length:672 start_codon:yes stop_codon:yes gene_type:complete